MDHGFSSYNSVVIASVMPGIARLMYSCREHMIHNHVLYSWSANTPHLPLGSTIGRRMLRQFIHLSIRNGACFGGGTTGLHHLPCRAHRMIV